MNFIRRYLQDEFQNKKLNSPLGFLAMALSALFIAKVSSISILGIVAFAGLMGIVFVVVSFVNPPMGFTITFVMSTSIFIIPRLANVEIPFGIARDALFVVILLGIAIKKIRQKEAISYKVRSPVTIMMLIYSSYLLVQFFNPEGTLSGWGFGVRGFLSYLSAYFILMSLFDDFKFVKAFTKLWIITAALAALYALFQEYAGLPPWDLKWVTATEHRIGLNFIGGRWRKWSFLSDAAAFGLFMAFGGIFCVLHSLGQRSGKRKLVLLGLGVMMLVSMAFSGTRAAYAVIPIGFFVYVLLTINRPRTLIFALFAGFFFVAIVFGPYQNSTIRRVRTAFQPTDDPSMVIRDINRASIQPYIYAHPMGGGLVTAGVPGERFAPNHRLAGFPPDSGYLETALEQGWIGLLIQLSIYFTVMAVGIKNYYASKSQMIRSLYISYICGFFALTIAVYAKTGVIQLPMGLVLMGLYALVYKLKQHDDAVYEAEQKLPKR